jgi:hypothetical protein
MGIAAGAHVMCESGDQEPGQHQQLAAKAKLGMLASPVRH